MKRFSHSFIVDCPIDKVWKFYTNINHLKVITPKEMNLEIIKSQSELIQEGSECWIQAKLVTNSRWHSKITYFREHEYVDEMKSGRFKTWKHMHKFKKINESKTEVMDQIDFELPFGFFGVLFENFVMRKLDEIFEWREKSTINALQKDLQV